MTKIYLIRHGQTDFNLHRRYCGWTDIDLNNQGRLQAEKLVAQFETIDIDIVCASHLKRAVQTARIIFQHQDLYLESDFAEMNFGILEGITADEAMAKFPDIYDTWVHSPWEVTLDAGESFQEFAQRVRRGFSLLLSRYKGKAIALVSHAGPIRLMLCDYFKRPQEDFWSIPQENGSVCMIEYE